MNTRTEERSAGASTSQSVAYPDLTICPSLPTADVIVNDFTPKLGWLSNVYSLGDYHLKEDLFQEGALGLLRAADRFDPKRGAKFSTFGEKYIRGGMQNFLRSEFKHRNTLSISDWSWRVACEDTDEQDDDALPRSPIECQQDISKFTLDVELRLVREPIAFIEKGFTHKQQRIFRLHYREGLTPSEVARVIQVSPARVSQVLSEAVAKLKQNFHLN